jgi:tetratricopeptide (TPR) repeat protein
LEKLNNSRDIGIKTNIHRGCDMIISGELDSEKRFLQYLSGNQREILGKVRSATKTIWDKPGLIIDLPDHSKSHFEKIMDLAYELFEAIEGRPLSGDEIYLLLLGAYLHDIGLQCDLAAYPRIKEIAENDFGASIEIESLTKENGRLPIDTQKKILLNHHLISAAWINYSYYSDETELRNTISLIDNYKIVKDIIDICRYHHSSLPLSSVGSSFYSKDIRKQLIVAILRFCDCMDFPGHKYGLDFIKQFNVPPETAIYWWTFNIANVKFFPKNKFTLSVTLTKMDRDSIGKYIYQYYVAEFQTRLKPIISILRINNINIKVESNFTLNSVGDVVNIPPAIYEYIEMIKSVKAKVRTRNGQSQIPSTLLANEIRIWLRAINYEVSEPREQKNIGATDILATMNKGTIEQTVLIRCIDGNINKKQLMDLADEFSSNFQCWLITNNKISDEIRDASLQLKNIRVLKFSEIFDDTIWKPYFDSLEASILRDDLDKIYVDINCYKGTWIENKSYDKEPPMSLDKYIDNWLKQGNNNHISILGGFGSGKTWFCRHYAYIQLKRFLEDPINERMPFLITLREFTKSLGISQLINDAFFEKYNLPFLGSGFDVFQDLNRQGKLLLLLDGFDEMAQKVNYNIAINNFEELAKLVDENSKVILTSRSEFFRQEEEVDAIFRKESSSIYPERFEIINLDSLNKDQIKQIIENRIDLSSNSEKNQINRERTASSLIKRIFQDNNLTELAQKPVMIQLLLNSIDEIEKELNIKQMDRTNVKPYALPNVLSSRIYLNATNKLILRNILEKRSFTSVEDKIIFLCELAWEMLRTGQWRLHYKAFPEKIKEHFSERIVGEGDLDNWDYDVRTQTLFKRNVEGYYEFDHRSIAEYFIAYKFALELGCISKEFIEKYFGKDYVLSDKLAEEKSILKLAESYGLYSLRSIEMSTVREFLSGMIPDIYAVKLWKIIDEANANIRAPDKIKFCAGNSAAILQDLGKWYNREEVKDLWNQLQSRPEMVFPLRPAKLNRIEAELQKIGFYAERNDLSNILSSSSYEVVKKSYDSLIKKDLASASKLAKKAYIKNKKIKELNLSIQAYIALEMMYRNNFNEAEKYLKEYLNSEGSGLWYNLKMSFIRIQQKRMQEAKNLAENSLSVSNETNNLQMKARSLQVLGIIERLNENFDKSIEYLKLALDMFVDLDDKYHQATTLANLGIAHRMIGSFNEAINFYDESHYIFTSTLKDNYLGACVEARKASALRMLNENRKALDGYERALAVFKLHDDDLRQGIVLSEFGTTYLIEGNWESAIDCYDESISILTKLTNSNVYSAYSRLGLAYYSKGLAYLMQGQWEGAVGPFLKALDSFEGDNFNLCLTYSAIGIAYRMSDNPLNAKIFLSKALLMSMRLKDRNRESLILLKLASVVRRLASENDKYSNFINSSLKIYRKSLKIIEELIIDLSNKGFSPTENQKLKELCLRKGKILGEIGTTFRMKNELNQAISNYDKANAIFKKQGDRIKTSWILESVGQVYSLQGLNEKAISEYMKALDELGLVINESSADDLVLITEGYIMHSGHLGGIQKYRADLDEIEKLGKLDIRGKILCSLGEAYRRLGKYDLAINKLEESKNLAKDIRDKDQEGLASCYLGLAYLNEAYANEGKFDQKMVWINYNMALNNIKHASGIFESLGDNFHEGWALEKLGTIFMIQKDWESALETLLKAKKINYNSKFINLSLSICYGCLGKNDESRIECQLANEALSKEGISEYDMACFEANCGDMEEAEILIKKAIEKGQTTLPLIKNDFYLRNLNYEKLGNIFARLGALNRQINISNIEIIPFM